MHSLFLSQIPVNEPLQIPQQGPYGDSSPFTMPSLHIFQIPYKIPLNKDMYSFSQRPLAKSVPPCSPKAGTLWKKTSISRALLSISFGDHQ